MVGSTGAGASMIAAKQPWTTRAPISQPTPGASPQATLDTAKPAHPRTITRRGSAVSTQRPMPRARAISGRR
jgi:hypothetical protein